jgi:NADPH:quinone reductase-like Zn-dependent oxidoreductase
MKAIVCTQYGPPDVLQFTEAAKPIPKDNEVLIKIHTASVNPVDRIFRAPYVVRILTGLRKPRDARVGRDMAGQIEDVGKNITRFKSGDEVFGVCRGAFAEYGCAIEDKLSLKPANISFEEAASVPVAALTALQGLRDKGQIQPGQKVLVDGASGGVGTFAVQIAKAFGAEVTAVCSIKKMDTARSIGADHVIDYAQQDFTKRGQRYDLILAANAYHSIFAYRRALGPRGIYVMAAGGGVQILQGMLLGPLLSLLGSKKMRFFIANINQKDLGLLKDLLETGKVVPVIDRRYPLSRVAEALSYLEGKHAKGKIVLTAEHGNEIAGSGFSGT